MSSPSPRPLGQSISAKFTRKFFGMAEYAPDWRTALSALLIVLAFPPWDFSAFIWICLVPWLAALQDARSAKAAFIQGLWFSIGMSWLGFYWVAYVLHEFGNVPWIVAVLGLFLYSLGGQPQFLVFGPLYRASRLRLRNSGFWAVSMLGSWLAALYTAIDWWIPKLFRDTLGHSLYLAPYLRQVADLGGAHGLTFLIFWSNFAALIFLQFLKGTVLKKNGASPASAIAAPQAQLCDVRFVVGSFSKAFALFLPVLLAAFLYGRHRALEWTQRLAHPARTVTAGVVQANIGDFDKVASEHGVAGAATRVVDQYLELSRTLLTQSPKPDLLVWPETAYPTTFGNPTNSIDMIQERKIRDFVDEARIPLLFGGYDRANNKDFNALFLLTPSELTLASGNKPYGAVAGPASENWNGISGRDNPAQVYRKSILLLFGEYVPFTENSAFFAKLFPQIGNFGRGPGPSVMPIRLSPDSILKAGPIICYEALFPEYVIQSANEGSELILNITNDSWFGPFGEPILHLSLSVFRSIETRLPQLRSTNTGISALVLQDGRIARQTGVNEEELMNVAIPLTEATPTLMKRWGDWFGLFATAMAVLGALFWLFFARARPCVPTRVSPSSVK